MLSAIQPSTAAILVRKACIPPGIAQVGQRTPNRPAPRVGHDMTNMPTQADARSSRSTSAGTKHQTNLRPPRVAVLLLQQLADCGQQQAEEHDA